MPPKSSAEVASLALTPDCVSPPALSFSGGAHADQAGEQRGPMRRRLPQGASMFIAEPSDGQEAARWRGGDGAGSPR